VPTSYYPRDANKIELTKNSQGYVTLEQQYKIVWSIKNPDRFCFTDHPIIFYMGKASIICSNNKNEILYLLSLLNSPITELILEQKLKTEQEKEYLIPIKAVKEYVRIPRITSKNTHIKKEIIKRTKQMLDLEGKTLSDFVDFSSVLVQKLSDVRVEANRLLLVHDNREMARSIKGDGELVARAIANEFQTGRLKLERHEITLSELRNLPVIDLEERTKLKDSIDDLVFALSFRIPLKEAGLDKAEEIREACSSSKYYQLL
jgi:hypothetical protein